MKFLLFIENRGVAMSISTRCPGCASLFKLPSDLAGKRVRCEKCKQMFDVPAAGQGDLELPLIPSTPTAPTKPEKPAAAPKRQPINDEILTGELVDDDLPLPATAVKNLGKNSTGRPVPRKPDLDEEDDEPPPIKRRHAEARVILRRRRDLCWSA